MPLTLRATLLALALLLPGACAQSPGRPQSTAAPDSEASAITDPTDPIEPVNRATFRANMAFDNAVFRPAALGYRHALPSWVRDRIRNVVSNLQEPRHSLNALLQGEPLVAGSSLMRFVVNSTMGLGGMFDMAPIGGPPYQPRDFGQTLHHWGVGDGPFLMLPVLGPSNVRDTVGLVADGYMNPISWLMPFWGNLSRGAAEGIDLRERNIESLDALREDSLDFYARLRSVWQQRRRSQLEESFGFGAHRPVLEVPGAPAVLDDPGATPPVLDDPGAAPGRAPMILDDPGATPPAPRAESRRAARPVATVSSRHAPRVARRQGKATIAAAPSRPAPPRQPVAPTRRLDTSVAELTATRQGQRTTPDAR